MLKFQSKNSDSSQSQTMCGYPSANTKDKFKNNNKLQEKKIFNSYEFLCIKRFQEDLQEYENGNIDCFDLWIFVKTLLEQVIKEHYNSNKAQGLQGYFWKFRFDKRIVADLWYLAVALDKSPEALLEFLTFEFSKLHSVGQGTPLSRYVFRNQIQEIHLDGVFKFEDGGVIPLEIFRCDNVRVLSLKSNSLRSIPPDIGRLVNLQVLCLTNNCLQNHSIPFSLTFCKNLTHVYLDNNALDALPGFLLSMPQLDTVYRHDNRNSFKSTFMWYHSDINERIRSTSTRDELFRKRKQPFQPVCLQDLAVRSVIASKENFFLPGLFPVALQNYIAREYNNYRVCGYCNNAEPIEKSGYKVFTFKTPYLGNTCVPFQHWACSYKCAEDIEKPAHAEQKYYSKKLEQAYLSYIEQINTEFEHSKKKNKCTIM